MEGEKGNGLEAEQLKQDRIRKFEELLPIIKISLSSGDRVLQFFKAELEEALKKGEGTKALSVISRQRRILHAIKDAAEHDIETISDLEDQIAQELEQE